MTLAASVWAVIFDSADREEAVRAALREALPVTGKESTWSTIKGALQQQAEPVVAQAAMGAPYPQNAGSTGALLLSGLTARTPRLATGPRNMSDGCSVARHTGGRS